MTDGVAHFPPGAAAPTAAQREADRIARLRDPAHLAKLNAARQEWLNLPKEERAARTKARKEEKARKAAEREERRAAKRGGSRSAAAPPPEHDDAAPESGPPTVRSTRSTLASPPPVSDRYRPMVGPVRGLLDLCASMPTLGDGSVFIQVTRVKPTTYQAIPCAGPQQPLWDPIDDAQFVLIYGGGEYSLRGYQTRDDGRAPLPITEPVAYKTAGHPNLDSLITEEDATMQRPMRPNGLGHVPGGLPRRGVVTPHVASAEAEMHDRDLTHQETMDQRNAERAERRRLRDEEEARRRESSSNEALKILAESRDREAERMKEMLLETKNGRGELHELLPLLQAMMPRGEDSKELVRQHAQEIKQLTESHKEEVVRLTEQHAGEMRRLTEQHQQMLLRLEDQVRADRERADVLIRETERRSNEAIREAERRADARVQDAQNAARSQYDDLRVRAEERLADLGRSWEARFNDARDNHARELKRKDDEIALMRSNLEGNMNVILSGKDTEIKRLQHEVREARDEAAKNKDWVGKIGEFEKQAEALGFKKDDGSDGAEESTKTLLIKGGMTALQQLPQMIQSGAQALAQLRGSGNPSEAARTRGSVRSSMRTVPRAHTPPALQPLAFGTEDSEISPVGLPASPLRSRPSQEPPPALTLEQSPVAPEPQYVPPPPPPPVSAPPPAPAQAVYVPNPEVPPQLPHAPEAAQGVAASAPPPAMSAPPPSSVVPASMAPPPVSTSGLSVEAVQVMDQLMPDLGKAFEDRMAARDVAQNLINATSVEVVRHVLGMATVDQVLGHINSNPGAYGNLATRAGQKFLREIWKSAQALAGGE